YSVRPPSPRPPPSRSLPTRPLCSSCTCGPASEASRERTESSSDAVRPGRDRGAFLRSARPASLEGSQLGSR
ncbi:hypothetical protein OH76DRAFT_1562283, partial [Lentinus brumalis]